MSVKIGVVGLGIGTVHVESLSKMPDAEIVAFADLDEAKVQKFASEHDARGYSDWRAMLDGESELDAVILATPARIRREPIEAICARKIALFCEKPPAMNLEEARQIRSLIEDAGILNTVGFMYRWAPLAVKMRDMIAGRPRLFARGVVAWPVFDWVLAGIAPKNLFRKSGCGGPLIEQAIHYQDVLRYITGDEPISVQAIAELGNLIPQEERDCEETTAYMLRHQSGMLSTHIHNWSHKGLVMDMQIVGDNYDLTWQMAQFDMKLIGTFEGEKIDEISDAGCYFEEMVGFVQAVREQDQSILRSSYADACQTLAVCEAGTEAINSGKAFAIPMN
ncbi:MAG: Gfo/Idh/MocA family oxidoreductase [Abditibacteriaceae bacterium]